MYPYIYTCIYTYTYIRIYIYIHIHIHVHIYIHTCTYTYIHTCMHACMHADRQTDRHTYTHIHTYIYIHSGKGKKDGGWTMKSHQYLVKLPNMKWTRWINPGTEVELGPMGLRLGSKWFAPILRHEEILKITQLMSSSPGFPKLLAQNMIVWYWTWPMKYIGTPHYGIPSLVTNPRNSW